MAYEDNENDEYHEPVPMVDVWMHYKTLANGGMTQQAIADAVGGGRTNVAYRLSYAEFPEKVLNAFVTNDFLKEGHARELDALSQCDNLTPWLDRETAMVEVIDAALKKQLH